MPQCKQKSPPSTPEVVFVHFRSPAERSVSVVTDPGGGTLPGHQVSGQPAGFGLRNRCVRSFVKITRPGGKSAQKGHWFSLGLEGYGLRTPSEEGPGRGGLGNPWAGVRPLPHQCGGLGATSGGTPVVASHWSEYRAPVAAGRLVCVAIFCVTLLSLSPLVTLAKHKTGRIKLQIQTEQS